MSSSDLAYLVEHAKRVLTDAPAGNSEVPRLAAEVARRVSLLVEELTRPPSHRARCRARARLAALAMVGLAVVGVDAPVTQHARKIWPPCPKCGAAPGQRCTTSTGKIVVTHRARKAAAHEATA